MLKIILLAIGITALAFGAIAIKLLFKKGGKFSGTCAGNSEFMRKEGVACPVCGAKPEEECRK